MGPKNSSWKSHVKRPQVDVRRLYLGDGESEDEDEKKED
jgi:hypothetical protein